MIQRFFLLLSAGLIWLANPPAAVSRIIEALGFDPAAGAGAFIHGIVIALGLLVLERAIALVQENLISPLATSYKGGVWIYSLLPRPNEEFSDERPTIGIFNIRRSRGGYRVSNGRAFQIRDGKLKKRGEWTADCLGVGEQGIDIIYHMVTDFRYGEEQEEEYDGHIRLADCDRKGLCGRAYRGRFNDLSRRSHVMGPVYAEHVSRFPVRRVKYDRYIERKFNELYAQLER